MVQAILEGRKSQTRRILKHQPAEGYVPKLITDHFGNYFVQFRKDAVHVETKILPLPYGQKGDVIWVREGFYTASHFDNQRPSMLKKLAVEVYYTADVQDYEIARPLHRGKSRPSIFLPADFARIFLKNKRVRIEKLWDISEEDAIAEGIDLSQDHKLSLTTLRNNESVPKHEAGIEFMNLWGRINGKESWDYNPWVFVYEFERTTLDKNQTKI